MIIKGKGKHCIFVDHCKQIYEFLLSRAIFLPQTLFTKQCKTGDMQEKYRFFLYPSISAELELEN